MHAKLSTDLLAADLKRVAPFVVGYTAAVLFGVGVLSPNATPAVWAANAILISGLLLLEGPARIYCVLLCVAGDLFAGLLLGNPPLRAITYASLNLAECCAVALLTRRVCGRNLNFSDGRRLFAFLAGAVLPGSAIVTVMLACMNVLMRLPLASVGGWFISHSLGAAMVVPAVTIIANRRRFTALARAPRELVLSMTVLTALAAALFWGQGQVSMLFLIFPAMMLTAFRYGPVGAAAGSLLVTALAGGFVNSGLEHMALGGVDQNLRAKVTWLQFFIASVFLTTLPASGAVASYARMRMLLAQRTLAARAARHRADCAAAAKGEFLANMSHEIRTPLNGVIGLADALSRTELAPDQHEMLKMILGSGKALTGLLGDALDLARADSGALQLTSEPFDVREAIGSAAYLFETLAVEKGLAFRVEFDIDAPGAAVGDALRIKQIVSNLMSNAVKFTAEGAVTLHVSLKPAPDGAVRLQAVVRDTGPGFDDTVKARLFNRFEQGDSSVTRRFGGSGLGLSIVQRLSQIMRGTVDCEAVPGMGAAFSFGVDLQPAAAIAVAHPEPSAPPTGRPSVLLAEDHPVNRKVIQAMLGDSVDLTIAVDGLAAVEAFGTQPFDVILMDTHMPLMDGLTAIRTIRAIERETGLARTPIVSLTADAMPQQVQAALAAGADLHLAKPITGDGLFGALNTCVRLRSEAGPLEAAG